ncbi:metallophosphoesterase family protein [Allorhizocola rhizosphaerae]|uniref:metallophosphoesterase family protein n=1 Tax=Allorhizocola rhizosphaerae TaxID=1872709 RepID=UPI000E3D2A22|nr:metallophosphoesterase [Allorhizocola rhizosphaerae]
MRIAFVGDVHGCVLHALGALLAWQDNCGQRLDAVIQVGDMGAFPSLERMDQPSRRFAAENPAQHDLFRMLAPTGELESAIRRAMTLLPPVLFVSGNHEDFEWLAGLHGGAGVVPIDPGGAFHHVACGQVITVAGQRVAFLGRIEKPGKMDLDAAAYARLMDVEPGSVDVLVTHDGPYGMGRDWLGEPVGSPKLSRLIARLRPRLHVSGHYHHANGPRHYGPTVSFALAQLVYSKVNRHRPDQDNPQQRVTPGSIGVLDTETFLFEYVNDDWLAGVCGDEFDLAGATARSARDYRESRL